MALEEEDGQFLVDGLSSASRIFSAGRRPRGGGCAGLLGGGSAAGSGRAARCRVRSTAVKWNRLPRPGSLWTPIVPCIISTSRRQMDSPRPVPP